MKKKRFDSLDDSTYGSRNITRIIIAVVIIVLFGAALLAGIWMQKKNKDPMGSVGDLTTEQDTKQQDTDDPENGSMGQESGAQVDASAILTASSAAENDQITLGIDVAKYQGTIDWSKVAASGIDFAMIRVGYRTQKTGEMCVDTNAKYNMQEAQANGIKIGVYFFSSAITEAEAEEEADWVADYISQYQITYPVAFDCEGFQDPDSRQSGLDREKRTGLAVAFMDEIYQKGYTPMFYAASGELQDSADWNLDAIQNSYKIWVAQYPEAPYPDTASSSYSGTHAMWQYTNQGTIPGIGTTVDLNVAYFGYDETAQAKDGEAPDAASADPEATMRFQDVNESVTAKESANLRNIPSQDTDSTVELTLNNGDVATRTGISDSGWSRLQYNGTTYYAVSSYLTTDLNYVAAGQEGSGSGDGLKTKFTDCNDVVTAKIEVNLRTIPSVTNPVAVVAAVLTNGETVTRTGINEEFGWSRVEYNGQTLYCISSYLTTAQ